jgi:hypothetical protein
MPFLPNVSISKTPVKHKYGQVPLKIISIFVGIAKKYYEPK